MIDKYDVKSIIQLSRYDDNGLVSQSAAKHIHCDVKNLVHGNFIGSIGQGYL